MKVLIAHNAYQQRGGEDSVVEAEMQLLLDNGHVVKLYSRNNKDADGISRVALASQTFWSNRTSDDVASLIADFKPDVIHVHNTFPLISPSLYWAAAKANVPVVQTLHNFRLFCPQAVFLREGKLCEDCLGHVPWRGVMHGCYRDSKAQTAVLAGMVTVHRAIGTWHNKVTRYIALNEFCRQKFIQGGLPAEHILIKPNFVDFAVQREVSRNGFLFVGRLSVEKGIETLALAMKQLSHVELRVAGTGPESPLFDHIAELKMLGALSADVVRVQMNQSTALVLPSIWYENFPRVLVEAFACGLPVIASRIGALAELIDDGVTGLLFEPSNANDLAAKLTWAQQNPEKMREMGRNARKAYERKYTAEQNYQQLKAIYDEAINALKNVN